MDWYNQGLLEVHIFFFSCLCLSRCRYVPSFHYYCYTFESRRNTAYEVCWQLSEVQAPFRAPILALSSSCSLCRRFIPGLSCFLRQWSLSSLRPALLAAGFSVDRYRGRICCSILLATLVSSLWCQSVLDFALFWMPGPRLSKGHLLPS